MPPKTSKKGPDGPGLSAQAESSVPRERRCHTAFARLESAGFSHGEHLNILHTDPENTAPEEYWLDWCAATAHKSSQYSSGAVFSGSVWRMLRCSPWLKPADSKRAKAVWQRRSRGTELSACADNPGPSGPSFDVFGGIGIGVRGV